MKNHQNKRIQSSIFTHRFWRDMIQLLFKVFLKKKKNIAFLCLFCLLTSEKSLWFVAADVIYTKERFYQQWIFVGIITGKTKAFKYYCFHIFLSQIFSSKNNFKITIAIIEQIFIYFLP